MLKFEWTHWRSSSCLMPVYNRINRRRGIRLRNIYLQEVPGVTVQLVCVLYKATSGEEIKIHTSLNLDIRLQHKCLEFGRLLVLEEYGDWNNILIVSWKCLVSRCQLPCFKWNMYNIFNSFSDYSWNSKTILF